MKIHFTLNDEINIMPGINLVEGRILQCISRMRPQLDLVFMVDSTYALTGNDYIKMVVVEEDTFYETLFHIKKSTDTPIINNQKEINISALLTVNDLEDNIYNNLSYNTNINQTIKELFNNEVETIAISTPISDPPFILEMQTKKEFLEDHTDENFIYFSIDGKLRIAGYSELMEKESEISITLPSPSITSMEMVINDIRVKEYLKKQKYIWYNWEKGEFEEQTITPEKDYPELKSILKENDNGENIFMAGTVYDVISSQKKKERNLKRVEKYIPFLNRQSFLWTNHPLIIPGETINITHIEHTAVGTKPTVDPIKSDKYLISSIATILKDELISKFTVVRIGVGK